MKKTGKEREREKKINKTHTEKQYTHLQQRNCITFDTQKKEPTSRIISLH